MMEAAAAQMNTTAARADIFGYVDTQTVPVAKDDP